MRLSVSSSASALLDDGRPEESAALMANSIRSPLYRLIPGNPNSVSCNTPSLAVSIGTLCYQTGVGSNPLEPIDGNCTLLHYQAHALAPFQAGRVQQRVDIDQHQVGQLTLLDGANGSLQPQTLGSSAGG